MSTHLEYILDAALLYPSWLLKSSPKMLYKAQVVETSHSVSASVLFVCIRSLPIILTLLPTTSCCLFANKLIALLIKHTHRIGEDLFQEGKRGKHTEKACSPLQALLPEGTAKNDSQHAGGGQPHTVVLRVSPVAHIVLAQHGEVLLQVGSGIRPGEAHRL